MRERYCEIAAQCDKGTMLQMKSASDCMEKHNRYMVNHEDYSTGNTIKYAQKQEKKVIRINPSSFTVEEL